MVVPLVGEDRPKCHICLEAFDDIGLLREHKKAVHGEDGAGSASQGPAPGDVSVF